VKTDRPKTVIMGAGNILMQDDGIGVHAVRALAKRQDIPDNVEIVDAGTAGADCLLQYPDIERLIIIDAVRGGGEPGTLYRLAPDDFRQARQGKISLHQMSLIDSLDADRLLGKLPREIIIIGVEPATIGEGMAVSDVIASQIPKVVETVLRIAAE
jgi:hydrogenase maturation protease